MAYGDYYNRETRARRQAPVYNTMGDLVDPPAEAPTPQPPVPQPADPRTLDRWGRPPGHPDFDKPPTGSEDFGPKSTGYVAAPAKRSHAYPGSALAYYGTGDIDGADDLQGGSHASKGVNTKGWGTGERGTNSIKNTAMKIATRYPPKPSSLDLWLNDPDTKRFFPNAKKVGFDKIDFGDGKPVDMIINANPDDDSGDAWSFQTESDDVPEGAGAGQTAARSAVTNTTQPVGTPAPLSQEPYRSLATSARRYPGPTMQDWFNGPLFNGAASSDEGFL
jgi:hypothetical protein